MSKRIQITQLQRVNEIFEQIRDLEDQKNDLSAMAQRVSENPHGDEVRITLSMGEMQEPKARQMVVVDGMEIPKSVLSHFMAPMFGNMHMAQKPVKEQRPADFIDEDIPDTLALQIIGLLIGQKNAQIKALVDQLVEMGFER